MGAIFGSLTALSIGLSDLFGRRVVLASSVMTAASVMQLVAVGASVLTLGLIGSEYRADDVVVGALSGLGLGTGLACYYGGLSRSGSTIVSPLVATLSALIPFVYTIVVGATPTALALGGAAVAVTEALATARTSMAETEAANAWASRSTSTATPYQRPSTGRAV